MRTILMILRDYYQTIVGIIALYVVFLVISSVLGPVFPIEYQYKSKILHFIIGVIFAGMFWYAAEQHQRAHLMNPLWFVFGSVWGASGLFFVRWILQVFGVRFGRPTGVFDILLYMAFPDWDLLVRGAHRNVLTHSAILTILLMGFAVYKKWKWLRDLGIGLAVGVASHLVWDVISVANYPYRYIKHLDGFAGAFWALGNAVLGVFVAYYLIGKAALPIDRHKDSLSDSL